MKARTVYECEFCGNQYKTTKKAYECEAKHLGLTMEEYKEYMNLLDEEKTAFGIAGCASNDVIRKRCDDAVKAVIAFQEKHGLEDNR